MKERPGAVKMNGSPLTLVGEEVSIGDAAPNFTVLDGALEPVEFSSFAGKVCIISSVPSLDTPVCDLQTRRFNEEAAALRPGVVVLTISMDLPFAQKRWCASAGIENMRMLSDHRRRLVRPRVRHANQGAAAACAGRFRRRRWRPSKICANC